MKSIFMFVGCLIVAAPFLSTASNCHAAMAPAVPYYDDPEPSKPILFSLGPSSRPGNFTEDSIKHIDGLPFSGIAYNLPATFTLMHSVQYGAWKEQDLHNQFGDLKFSFDNVDQNWVSIVVRRNGLAVAEGEFTGYPELCRSSKHR